MIHSKFKTVLMIIISILLVAVVASISVSAITKTTPKDWFNKSDNVGSSIENPDEKPPVKTPDEEPPVENPADEFKLIDSATPVSFKADSEGQHLYINTDRTALESFKSSFVSEGGFVLYAFKNPYSGDENDFDEFLEGKGDFAFVMMCYGDYIYIDLNRYPMLIYCFSTDEFGYSDKNDVALTVSENGEIIFDDGTLSNLEIDFVYLYPASVFSLKGHGDYDNVELASVEEINKIFAFSPFESKSQSVEKPPVDEFKPIDSSIPVSLKADGDGQHLYINKDITALNAGIAYGEELIEELEYKGVYSLLLFASTVPLNDDMDIDLGNGFVIEYSSGQFLVEGEARAYIYQSLTNEFGDVDNGDLFVSENGQITLSDTFLTELGSDTFYFYPMISILPFIPELEEGFENFVWSVEEINKLFAFSPFGSQQ